MLLQRDVPRLFASPGDREGAGEEGERDGLQGGAKCQDASLPPGHGHVAATEDAALSAREGSDVRQPGTLEHPHRTAGITCDEGRHNFCAVRRSRRRARYRLELFCPM